MRVQRYLLALGALLLVEYLVLSLLFDVRSLESQTGPLSALAYLGDVAVIGMLAIAFAVMLHGPKLREALRAATEEQAPRRSAWPFLLLHAIAYVALLFTSQRLLGTHADPASATTWVWPWLISGVVVVGSIAPIALPLSAARALLPTGLSSLVFAALGGIVVWGFAVASDSLWPLLAGTTLAACAWLLDQVSDLEVLTPGNAEFGTPYFLVRISSECSGLEGMGLLLAFLGGYVIVHRDSLRLSRALLLLPVAVAASYLANVVRIVALVLVGTWVSPEIALGGFHSKAGWVLFCMLAFAFVIPLRRSRYFTIPTQDSSPGELENVTAPYLMPLLGMIASALITGLIGAGFDPLYGVRALVMLVILWVYRRAYTEHWVRPGWHAFAIGVLVFVVWIALVPGHGTEDAASLQAGLKTLSDPARAVWIALRVFAAVVLVPIAEELAFRGYLLRRIQSRDFTTVAYQTFGIGSFLGSSLAFGLLHSQPIAGTIAGAAYALAQYRRGRLIDAIVAHAVTNGLLAAYVLLTGAWGLW